MTDEFPLVWIIPFVVTDPAAGRLVYLAAAAQESIRGPVFQLVTGPRSGGSSIALAQTSALRILSARLDQPGVRVKQTRGNRVYPFE
jgi:hypothetical protein